MTEPFRPLLDREKSEAAIANLVDIVCEPLREVVNYATNTLTRCLATAPSISDAVDVHVAPFYLYRQSIQLTDAIEVLLSKSCVESVVPSLRSLYTSVLSLKYILEDDYERRSLAAFCGSIKQRLRFRRAEIRYYMSTRNIEVADELSSSDIEALESEIQSSIKNLETVLKEPHMEEVVETYNKRKGFPRWYSLFGGPANLEQLNERVGHKDLYDICYRRWSFIDHAEAATQAFGLSEEGQSTVYPIRYPAELYKLGEWAIIFLTDATVQMIEYYRPGESEARAEWWTSTIQPALLKLQQSKIKMEAETYERW